MLFILRFVEDTRVCMYEVGKQASEQATDRERKPLGQSWADDDWAASPFPLKPESAHLQEDLKKKKRSNKRRRRVWSTLSISTFTRHLQRFSSFSCQVKFSLSLKSLIVEENCVQFDG